MDSNRELNKLKYIVNKDIEINDTVYNFVGDIEYLIKEHYIVNKALRKRLYEIADSLDKELEKIFNDMKWSFNQYETNQTALIKGKINELKDIIYVFNEIKSKYLIELESFKSSIVETNKNQYTELTNYVNDNVNLAKNELNKLIFEKTLTLSQTIDQEIQALKSLKNSVESIKLNSETKFLSLNELETKLNTKLSQLENINELVKSILNDNLKLYGIGTNEINNFNLNNYLKNGLYVNNRDESRIGNITTSVVNFQYDNKWGVQLALTEEDDPKLYIRAKRNGNWTSYKEVAYKKDIEDIYTMADFINNFKTN